MNTPRFSPDDPREWLNRAQSSLLKAQVSAVVPGIYLESEPVTREECEEALRIAGRVLVWARAIVLQDGKA
jgi:HEPN domain-containing protein